MKKNIIIAALSAASALLLCASCQKQELIEQNNGNASGKTFTATIEQGLTKTTITSEYKVNWVEGDQIDINGSIFSATPDASDSTKASLTKVSGPDPIGEYGYTAVYPASIMVESQPTLPATQTYTAGKFNAPMCAMSDTETLEFKNFCSVLCFALKGTDEVKSIAVTANEQLCGPFEFSTDATFGCFSGENEGYTVTLDCGEGVQLDASTATNFYVYLPPKDSYTAGMKIVVTSTEGKTFEKTTTTAVKIERNNLYTFDWTASFSGSTPIVPDGFVDLGVKTADGKPLFWAEKNLGASNPEDYGDYFAWGETAPYYTTTGGWPATPAWKEGKASGYKWDSYCGQSSFVEWSTPPYDANTKILKPEFDAATAANSSWRTPTSDEFKALAAGCVWVSTTNYKSTGKAGYIVYKAKSDADKGKANMNGTWKKWDVSKSSYVTDGASEATGYTTSDTHIFFPAAGYDNGTNLTSAGSYSSYWSSSLDTGATDKVYYLYFGLGNVMPQKSNYRYRGYSVRPVKAAAAPLPAGALSGEFSVSATKKVRFSQGNLVATIDASGAPTAWKFSTNQYDCLGEGGANKTIGATAGDVDLFGWSTAKTTYGINTSTVFSDYSGDFVDWGKAYCEKNSIAEGTWRTLTKDEWAYMINKDGNENIRKGKYKYGVTVCEKANCLILAPDDFEGTIAASYDAAAWVTAKAAGLVCLPAVGIRDGFTIHNVGSFGLYWSSSAKNEDSVYHVGFGSDDVDPVTASSRFFGLSVRLVTEVPAAGSTIEDFNKKNDDPGNWK